mmetsp:Transcript_54346/g.151361  ORF Transcript_54346/g.151361 Transcript_54346/m.151361 type:complete len:217 (+) Transcript_54346:564-1214(+)
MSFFDMGLPQDRWQKMTSCVFASCSDDSPSPDCVRPSCMDPRSVGLAVEDVDAAYAGPNTRETAMLSSAWSSLAASASSERNAVLAASCLAARLFAHTPLIHEPEKPGKRTFATWPPSTSRIVYVTSPGSKSLPNNCTHTSCSLDLATGSESSRLASMMEAFVSLPEACSGNGLWTAISDLGLGRVLPTRTEPRQSSRAAFAAATTRCRVKPQNAP